MAARRIETIVLHHSASRAAYHSWAEIRQWHLARGWSDIGYHFGVVFDGDPGRWSVKRGRPVEIAGAHAKGFNARSIGVCFEGDYSTSELPRAAFDLGARLVADLLVEFPTVRRVCGHRDLPYPTECPGEMFPTAAIVAEAQRLAGRRL